MQMDIFVKSLKAEKIPAVASLWGLLGCSTPLVSAAVGKCAKYQFLYANLKIYFPLYFEFHWGTIMFLQILRWEVHF